jgi:hypothetical protein
MQIVPPVSAQLDRLFTSALNFKVIILLYFVLLLFHSIILSRTREKPLLTNICSSHIWTMAEPNEVASANRVEVGSFPCPIASYPKAARFEGQDACKIAVKWTEAFNSMLSSRNYDDLAKLFCEESYWRDQLCLSWDFRTLKGHEKMGHLLGDEGTGTTIKSIKIDTSAPHRAPMESSVDAYGEHPCVLAFLIIETTLGQSAGLVKLVQDVEGEDNWRAFTLFTTLRELEGYEEATGLRRPLGVEHGGMLGRKNWQDRRNDQEDFAHEDPTVLIVGMWNVI